MGTGIKLSVEGLPIRNGIFSMLKKLVDQVSPK
jgi:hypothetical protein